MDTDQESTIYTASKLVKFFHSFPHYDIQFSPVSSDFKPDDKSYQESLLLIAAVPVLWMLLWILIYMIYFCYFCVTCRRHHIEKSRKSSRPARWCSFFFSILVILVVAVAIFGNELVDYSLKKANSQLNDISDRTDKAALQSAPLLHSIDVLNNYTGAYLNTKYERNGKLDETDRPMLVGTVSLMRSALLNASITFRYGIRDPLTQLELDNSQFTSVLNQYELYRRIASHAVSGFLMIATALSLCALGSKRKPFLLACVAISIFNLIIVWVAVGFYGGLAVGTADLCTEPTDYLLSFNDDSQEAVRYYFECEPAVNPFHKVVVVLQDQLHTVDSKLVKMLTKADLLEPEVIQNISNAQDSLQSIQSELLELSSATDCTSSHRNYVSAINEVCKTSLVGQVAVFGSFASAGTFIIILVFLMHTAARYNGNRRAYFEVDSQDNDYQSRGENNRSDNPLYYRFSQISTTEDNTRVAATTSNANVQPTAPARSSPPPAYTQNHKDFYSTYGNNGTLDSNTRVPTASNDLNRNSNTFRT